VKQGDRPVKRRTVFGCWHTATLKNRRHDRLVPTVDWNSAGVSIGQLMKGTKGEGMLKLGVGFGLEGKRGIKINF